MNLPIEQMYNYLIFDRATAITIKIDVFYNRRSHHLGMSYIAMRSNERKISIKTVFDLSSQKENSQF